MHEHANVYISEWKTYFYDTHNAGLSKHNINNFTLKFNNESYSHAHWEQFLKCTSTLLLKHVEKKYTWRKTSGSFFILLGKYQLCYNSV